jgi:hypothetical protein
MANTYTLIEAKTLTTTTADITFSSIPQIYTDLCLVFSVRGSVADNGASIRFNGSASNLSARNIWSDGNSVTSNISSSSIFLYGGQNSPSWTANTFNNAQAYIPNYTGSNHKSVSVDAANENNGTDAYMSFTAGLWSDTSAITSVTILPGSGSFVQYSSAYLYGIKNS